MYKEKIISNSTSKCLLPMVETYTMFVKRVLHDKAFLEDLNKIMPFGKMLHAHQTMPISASDIREMGVSLMRMDIDPPLYSLALTLVFRDADGLTQDKSVFMIACKTIAQLQQLVTERTFVDRVLSICSKTLFSDNFNFLQR